MLIFKLDMIKNKTNKFIWKFWSLRILIFIKSNTKKNMKDVLKLIYHHGIDLFFKQILCKILLLLIIKVINKFILRILK